MSNEQEVPFWRKPLPPIPGPRSRPLAVADDVVLLEVGDHDFKKEPQPVHVEPEPEPVEAQPVDFYRAAKAAEHALDVARAEARERRTATVAARAAFATALERWNTSQPVMTQMDQAREFIAASNADRAARAAAGRGIVHAGITRTAKAYAQGNQQRGGGRAYVRGPDGTKAFSKAEAMTLEARRLQVAAAAAAAAKPRGQ